MGRHADSANIRTALHNIMLTAWLQLEPAEAVGWPHHPQHIKLTWTGGSRAARNNIDQFNGERFSIVTLDYFRFPSYYMKEVCMTAACVALTTEACRTGLVERSATPLHPSQQAYPVTLFTNFLARGLLNEGILVPGFVVYVPNNSPMQGRASQKDILTRLTRSHCHKPTMA